MSADDQAWFYLERDEQRGPCDGAALLTALRQGTLSVRTRIWRPGMAAWTPAIEVAEIISQLPPVLASAMPSEPISSSMTAPLPSLLAAPTNAKPWPRYFARWFDTMFASLAVGAIVGAIVELTSPSPILTNKLVLGMLALAVWAVVEGPILSRSGTTPGKALLGIFVRTIDGRKPGLADAFKRGVRVWMEGLAFGLPIVFLLTWNRQHRRLLAGQSTTWDTGKFAVFKMPSTAGRKMIIAVLTAVLLALIVFGNAR